MGESDSARPSNRATVRGAKGTSSSVLTPPTGLPTVDDLDAHLALPAQRSGSGVAPTAPPAAPPTAPLAASRVGLCTCGHAPEAHEHYRHGTDCGACGSEVCAAYAPRGERKGGLLRTLGLRR